MLHAEPPLLLYFLIGKLEHFPSPSWKLLQISHFCSCHTLVSVPITRIFERFGKKKALWSTSSSKRYCWILQLHFKFKNHQIKFSNCFMQNLLCFFIFLIGKLEHFASHSGKLLQISYFCSCHTLLSVPITRIFERFGKKKALWSTSSLKRYCWIIQLHFKFKIHQMQFKNWFMQDLLWSSVS